MGTPIHPILFELAADALIEVFFEDRLADKVLEFTFKRNAKLGRRDRKFIAELVYDGIRLWRRIWFLIQRDPNDSIDLIFFLVTLRYVKTGEWTEDLGRLGKFEMPNDFDVQVGKARKNPGVWFSYPDWMMRYWQEQCPETWAADVEELNHMAPVDLRTNLSKATRDQVIASLAEEKIQAVPIKETEAGIKLTERKNVFSSKAFKSGWFEVQDRSSQKVALFAPLSSGQTIVDACAGAGGKTLHLADCLRNTGRVIALDVAERKLVELKLRARRGSFSNIETRLIENKKTIKRLEGRANVLLLDVPCTGSGVIRRNPDSKWRLSFERVNELLQIQQQILQDYCSMVQNGGYLVYSTCSVFPSENQLQVEKFLQQNPQFKLEQQQVIRPSAETGDGFFMARMKKEA